MATKKQNKESKKENPKCTYGTACGACKKGKCTWHDYCYYQAKPAK